MGWQPAADAAQLAVSLWRQVAETFAMAAGDGGPVLSEVARLDTCVTVVDAANLMANL